MKQLCVIDAEDQNYPIKSGRQSSPIELGPVIADVVAANAKIDNFENVADASLIQSILEKNR